MRITSSGVSERVAQCDLCVDVAPRHVVRAMQSAFVYVCMKLPWVKRFKVERTDGDDVRVVADVYLSRTLGLTAKTRLLCHVDEAASAFTVTTEDATMVRYAATFRVAPDAHAIGSSRIDIEMRLNCSSLFKIMPYIIADAKIQSFCATLMDVLAHSIDVKKRLVAHTARMHEHAPLVARVLLEGAPSELHDDLRRLFEYNCVGGKMYRGFIASTLVSAAVDAVDEAVQGELCYLCWKCEALQAFALIEDDIMDESPDRRGKPSWWKVVGVATALSDGLVLQQLARRLVDFVGADVQERVRHVSDEIEHATAIGQSLDAKMEGAPLGRFTRALYEDIVLHKTSMYTFYEPFAYGILLLRRDADAERALLRDAKRLCALIGLYFQMQDDFLDCYAAASQLGKQASDVRRGKCAWPILEALRAADAAQRALLERHYGVDTDADEAEVLRVFNALELPRRYRDAERELIGRIRALGDEIDPILASTAVDILSVLLKRNVETQDHGAAQSAVETSMRP